MSGSTRRHSLVGLVVTLADVGERIAHANTHTHTHTHTDSLDYETRDFGVLIHLSKHTVKNQCILWQPGQFMKIVTSLSAN